MIEQFDGGFEVSWLVTPDREDVLLIHNPYTDYGPSLSAGSRSLDDTDSKIFQTRALTPEHHKEFMLACQKDISVSAIGAPAVLAVMRSIAGLEDIFQDF